METFGASALVVDMHDRIAQHLWRMVVQGLDEMLFEARRVLIEQRRHMRGWRRRWRLDHP